MSPLAGFPAKRSHMTVIVDLHDTLIDRVNIPGHLRVGYKTGESHVKYIYIPLLELW